MNVLTYRTLPTLILSTALLCLGSQSAAQQVPVVDAQGAEPAQRQSQNRSAGGGGSADLVYELYSRLDQLQQEMQSLRGLVEQQTHRIQQMEREQRDRYLDLDQRVSELSGAGARSGQGGDNLYPPGMVPMNEDIADEMAGQSQGQGQANVAASGDNDATSLDSTPENEQQIYRSALNTLLEEGQYEEAIRGFQRYIDNYPQGRYFTNALYWQGEALILAGRYAEAQNAFSRVVEEYPEDPKAAGALLKMGVAYQQTDQVDRAREVWQSLRNRYPDSLTEIRAAEDYLRRLPSP